MESPLPDMQSQDPDLLVSIFMSKAQRQPTKATQLAEICSNLAERIDGFLPALLRQLQRQYREG